MIMETSELKPKNIFEQILFGQIAINDNIVAVSKNIEVLNQRIDDFMSVAKSVEVLNERMDDIVSVFTANSAVVEKQTDLLSN